MWEQSEVYLDTIWFKYLCKFLLSYYVKFYSILLYIILIALYLHNHSRSSNGTHTYVCDLRSYDYQVNEYKIQCKELINKCFRNDIRNLDAHA